MAVYRKFETTTELVWEDPADGSTWRLRFQWAGPVGSGRRVECVGLEVRVEPPEQAPSRSLTTGRLRRLNLGTLIGAEKAKLRDRILPEVERRAAGLAKELPWDAAREALEPPAQTPRGRGRPARYDLEHFQQVAEVYRRNYLGMGSTPTKAVAETYGVSVATAKKWVARARKMGLLGSTEPGQPGV